MARAAQRILVVDDDAVTRHILVGYLHRAGFETLAATSGDEAVALAAQHTPALVLLDLVLPAPDGYEVLRLLRRDAVTRDVPVVVLTALEGDLEIERAFEAGADDFLRKPFRAAELLARIRGQLRLRSYLVALAQKEHDARVMLDLTRSLASSLAAPDVLYSVVRRIAEVVNVERCSLVVAPGQGDVGYVVAASDDPSVQSLPLELGKYPEIRKVLASGAPVTIDDVSTHPLLDAVRDRVSSAPFASLTLLPIIYEDVPMGVLFLRASSERGRLGERELSFCQIVANAMAVSLRNTRVVQELRDESRASKTARVEAEQQMRSLERYWDLFMSASDGMVVIDHEGKTLFANPRATEILGYSESELRARNAATLVVREERARLVQIRRGFLAGSFPANLDLRVRCKAGTVCTLSMSFSELLREDNAVLLTFRDVSEDRATAQELARTKDFLTALIESSPDAIVAADQHGTMLLWNGAAERICGIPRGDVVGRRNVRSIYPSGVARDVMKKIRGSGHGGEGRLEGYRSEVLDAHGEKIPIVLSAGLIFDHGKAAGTVGIFSDLREKLRMEAQLASVEQRLAFSEKQRVAAELAGAAAHEMNQPLTSIIGYAELLLRKVDAESPAAHAATVLMREAERMAEIVRKLGTITRYETKEYVGGTSIIDLDRAAAPPPSGAPGPTGRVVR